MSRSTLLASARPLKDRARVHLHAYTAETIAEVVLIGQQGTSVPAKAVWLNCGSPSGRAASRGPLHPAAVFSGGHHRRRLRARRRSAGAPHQRRRALGILAHACKVFRAKNCSPPASRGARRAELSLADAVAETGWLAAQLAPVVAALVQAKQIVQIGETARRLRFLPERAHRAAEPAYIVPR